MSSFTEAGDYVPSIEVVHPQEEESLCIHAPPTGTASMNLLSHIFSPGASH